jgi:uncharacterized repeat protein (TIGR01451 family)
VRGGKTLSFTITVRNRGNGVARGVQVCDRLPDVLVFVRAPGARFTGGEACWHIARLGPGAKRTHHLVARADRVNRATSVSNVVRIGGANVRSCSVRTLSTAGQRARCSGRASFRVLPAIARKGRGGGVTG